MANGTDLQINASIVPQVQSNFKRNAERQLDAQHITTTATVEVNTNQLNEELKIIQQKIQTQQRELNKTNNLKVKAESKPTSQQNIKSIEQYNKKIERLQANINELRGKEVNIRIKLNDGVTPKLNETEEKINNSVSNAEQQLINYDRTIIKTRDDTGALTTTTSEYVDGLGRVVTTVRQYADEQNRFVTETSRTLNGNKLGNTLTTINTDLTESIRLFDIVRTEVNQTQGSFNGFRSAITTIDETSASGQELRTQIDKYTDSMGRAHEVTRKFERDENGLFTRQVGRSIDKVTNGVDNLNKHTNKFMSSLLRVAKFKIMNAMINTFYRAISEAKEAVKEFDGALTEFKKVSDLSGESLDEYTKKLGKLGDAVARTRKHSVRVCIVICTKNLSKTRSS